MENWASAIHFWKKRTERYVRRRELPEAKSVEAEPLPRNGVYRDGRHETCDIAAPVESGRSGVILRH